MSYPRKKRPVVLSICILACNEEASIQSMLGSLFRQTVFDRLAARLEQCSTAHAAPAASEAVLSETNWEPK